MNKILQDDFEQEGNHQWTLNYKGYRVVARQTDGQVEIIIRAEVKQDPTAEDWEHILKTTNTFYKKLVTAEERE